MRQCPSCRTPSSFSAPVCEHCGLGFYKGSRWPTMTAICLRIGGGAILLGAVAANVLKVRSDYRRSGFAAFRDFALPSVSLVQPVLD